MVTAINPTRITVCPECGEVNNKQREDCRKCRATLWANIPSEGTVVQVWREGRMVEEVVDREWCDRCFRDMPTSQEIERNSGEPTIEECRTCGGLRIEKEV